MGYYFTVFLIVAGMYVLGRTAPINKHETARMEAAMVKRIINIIGLVLVCAVNSAHAIPTLFFDGNLTYASGSGQLSVNSVLTATTDITPTPEVLGSSLSFSAVLDSVDTTNTYLTTGIFNGIGSNSIAVTDGNLNNLLSGNFSGLKMMGWNGRDTGRVSGVVTATGGTLEPLFGAGNLIALEFNLSTIFSSTMFDSDFTGLIDGRIEGQSVPEPGVLAMLGLGLALMGFVRSGSAKKQ